MRYLIYLRVSTEKQEDSGLGLDAQRHACNEWLKDKEAAEKVEYIEIVTGTDRKRKELEQRPKLLEILSNLKPKDVILISKRDRLGRDPYINAMIERIIEKKNAKLCCASGEMDGDQPHDILMRRIVDAFAEYEALMISTRTKAALARKKAKGERVGHIPYGYRLNSAKQIEVDPSEAKTVELMYSLRMHERMTFRQIAKRLNDQGYRNRNSTPWTYGATARVYKNWPAVCEAVRASSLQVA